MFSADNRPTFGVSLPSSASFNRLGPAAAQSWREKRQVSGDRRLRSALLGAIAALALSGPPTYAQSDRNSSLATVPVMIAPYVGGVYDDHGNILREPNCSSTGTVKVDDFLALKTGPGLNFPRIAKLPNGQMLIICNDQHGPQGWMAVIVEDDKGIAACFPRHSDLRAGPYAGPCKAGWVSEKYVGNLAD